MLRTNILYYEVLNSPLVQLEKVKYVEVQFFNEKVQLEGRHVIQLPMEKTVHDLVQHVRSRIGREHAKKDIRLMEVLSSRIFKVQPTSVYLG